MNDLNSCTCGHTYAEHGGDPDLPGSSACTIDDCDCVCFEEDADEE